MASQRAAGKGYGFNAGDDGETEANCERTEDAALPGGRMRFERPMKTRVVNPAVVH